MSSVQHVLDYKRLADDFDFAMIMATEARTVVGQGLRRHYDGCRSAGLDIGLVHFARPDLNPNGWAVELANFRNATEGMHASLGRWLDYEKRTPLPQVWVDGWLGEGGSGLIYSAPTYISGKVRQTAVLKRGRTLLDRLFRREVGTAEERLPIWIAGGFRDRAAMHEEGWNIVFHQQPKKAEHPMVRKANGNLGEFCEEMWTRDEPAYLLFKRDVRRGRWNQR